MGLTPETKKQLESIIASDEVVLFMKGTRSFPQCGFSSTVVNILNGLVPKYTTVNVLTSPELRDGIKVFSDWPTIPQLYVRGEFIGGCDIVKGMFERGELHSLLGKAGASDAAVELHVTPAAVAELRAALSDGGPQDVVHLSIDERFEHGLDIGPKMPGAKVLEVAGLPISLDAGSLSRARGVTIDFVSTGATTGFKIDNPNKPAGVRQLRPQELKAMLDAGQVSEFYDVRTEAERKTATLGAKLFDDAAIAHISALPKDTLLVFHCHHGGRSQNAANHFLSQGFRNVCNLVGGIDAWSREIDPSIPRY